MTAFNTKANPVDLFFLICKRFLIQCVLCCHFMVLVCFIVCQMQMQVVPWQRRFFYCTWFQTIKKNYSIVLAESVANKHQAAYPIRETSPASASWHLDSEMVVNIQGRSTQIFQFICYLDTKYQLCLTYPGIIGKTGVARWCGG